VLAGALTPATADVHYVNHFRYPSHGGFVSYLHPFVERTTLSLEREVVEVDPGRRTLRFADGTSVEYRELISSMPLPELIPRITRVPPEIIEASQRLACTSCVTVNLVVDRPDLSDAHWTYFYDTDFFFTRLAFPHMQSPHNVPRGMGSIQAEVYYSNKYRPIDRPPEACIDPVVADLRRCGLLRESDTIVFKNAALVPYANVIFDLDRADALAVVHAYLDEVGIVYCGRYGEWGYHWTDEAFISGENAAQKILDGCSRTASLAGAAS